MAMLFGQLACEIAAQIINAWPNKKLLHYPYLQQLRDMLPAMSLSLIMAVLVWSISLIGLPDLITLPLQLLLGVGIYLLGSWLFRLDSFEYVLDIVRKLLHRKTEASA